MHIGKRNLVLNSIGELYENGKFGKLYILNELRDLLLDNG